MYDVACIGILVADVITKTVDRLPEKGKLDLMSQLELYTGGCACNAAIDMAKLGLNAAVVGKVGSDGFGNFLYNSLKQEGVAVEGLVMDPSESTSASVVLSDSNGERTFLHCLGANASFNERDINHDILDKSKIVFIAGTMLMSSFDGEPCANILKMAKEAGKLTVLDTAWDSTGRWMKVLKPCMEYIDIFIPSYEEAQALSNKTAPEEICDVFLNLGVKTAVIKLGSEGCFIKDSSGMKHSIPSFNVTNPVDTTGAGDSFVAGFLTALSRGWNLYECGRFANAVGAHCVMAMGASTGIKSFDDTLKFINDYKED